MGQEHAALIAGASGLIGQELLPLLLARAEYSTVHSLVRRESGKPNVKLREHVVDFGSLSGSSLDPVAHTYITLGTTMKKAGSKEAFRLVDFDYIVGVARAARNAGATTIALVSSLGASAQSSVFYNKTKGEAEDAIVAMDFDRVILLRPSILDGDRQEERPAERVGIAVAKALSFLVPKKYQAVHVKRVAEAMIAATLAAGKHESGDRVRVIESDEIQRGVM